MSDFKVVVSDDRHHGDYDRERKILSACNCSLTVCNCTTEDEVIESCRDADAVLVNLAPITQRVLSNLKNCKVISRYGVGYDNVDVDACTKNGIYLTIVDGFCAEDVSDHALALLLSSARQVTLRDREIRAGSWNCPDNAPIYRLRGKTVSFLGFGTIAMRLFAKLSGFGISEFLAYSNRDEAELASLGIKKVSLDEALMNADFISCHLPLRPDTRGIISTREFSLMKPSAIFINTARGPIVDTNALCDALIHKKIAAAATDVYDKEPLEFESPLRTAPNCILTDHIGWYSEESFDELKTRAAQNVAAVLCGQRPPCIVNNF